MGLSENVGYIPNEIAIWKRDNDHEKPLGVGVHYFQTNPYIYIYMGILWEYYGNIMGKLDFTSNYGNIPWDYHFCSSIFIIYIATILSVYIYEYGWWWLINIGMMNVDKWWTMNGWFWVNLITTSLWPHCDLIVRKGHEPHSWPQDSG